MVALPLSISEMATPQEASSGIETHWFEVRRGRDEEEEAGTPDSGDCGRLGMSALTRGCPASEDRLGWVKLTFVPPADDNTPAEQMGYRIVLVEGALPSGMQLPNDPVRSYLSYQDELGLGDRWRGSSVAANLNDPCLQSR
jgi:hypothetical protein